MSKLGITLIGLVLILVISLQFFDRVNNNPVTEPYSEMIKSETPDHPLNVAVIPATRIITPPEPRPWPVAVPTEEIVVNERKLQEDQNRLSALIEQYNQNLSDPEKRKEIEQLVSQTAESYKQEVLAKVKSLQQNISSIE